MQVMAHDHRKPSDDVLGTIMVISFQRAIVNRYGLFGKRQW